LKRERPETEDRWSRDRRPTPENSVLVVRETPEEPAGPDLRRRRWRWAFYVGLWTFVGLLFVIPVIAQSLAERQGIPWSKVISDFLNWYIWGLLSPLIWWISQRFPFERRKLLSWVPINLACGLIVSLLFVVLVLIKKDLITAVRFGRFSFNALGDLPDYLYGGFEFFLLPYFAIVAFAHALSYYQKYRARELKTSRLETQLAQAHLEVLKMQLRPHFLFNTLNAISALMHRDVDAADRMIVLLSDLLRRSLDQDDRHQVPLTDELEFLERYLAIEQIRFRDRLAVEVEVEPPCKEAQVPRLILQPLVENSIRHGIAMRSAAGKIAIRAERRGERLAVVVWDDGPGLPGDHPVREGVGISNTRARLEQIYGPDHRFELQNAPDGGMEARLEIPFERRPREAIRGAA